MICGSCSEKVDNVQHVKDCYNKSRDVKIPSTPPSQGAPPTERYKVAKKWLSEKELEEEIPVGRYAIQTDRQDKLHFYQVSEGKAGTRWAGYKFLKEQASDELYPVRNRAHRVEIYRAIVAVGVMEAMARYGKELGSCGVCGRTLTDDISRRIGIGPKCRTASPLAAGSLLSE